MKELPSIDELNATAPQRDALVRTDGGGEELPSLAELNGETEGERGGEGAPTPLPSLAELNGELPTLAELNGETGEKAQKKDLGIWETMKTEKEAQLGKKMGDLEAAARYLLPVAGKALDAKEMRKASVEERLATGDFRDSLEATKLALTIGVPQEELRKINDETRGDDAAMRERFAGLTKERYAQRLATWMEAGQKLEGNELGWWEKVGKGLLENAKTPVEFANPVLMALSTGGNIIERGAKLEEQGETREKTWLKAIAGGVAEQQIWASPVVEKMIKTVGGTIVRAAEQALGLSGRKWIAGTAEAVTKKLGESESGRLLMKTAEVLGKVDEKTHFGSLPKMIMKTRLTEFADEVVGLNYVGEDTAGKRFGDWFEKCISIEDNVELLTGIIGIHAVMAGASAVKARRMEKAFREGRTDLVGEYIGYDQAKKLSNEDLGNIYKLITSPNLTVEKVETFLNGIADAKNAKLTAAAKKIGETLEERRTVTPEMEAALDAKVAEYAEGNEAVAAKIKGDIVDRLQDNRGLTDPDILEEMVAQSARRFNPEARRMKAHDLRGETDVGKQMTGIEEMGVTSWEQAEAEGLTQKDKLGRYTGGARQALNISIHGTEKLKASVRDGKISGDLAEDLLTTAQCELGARPKEEQAKLIDAILDAAGGDEALARRILAKIEERDADGGGWTEPDRIGRLAEEAKAESIRERNPGISEEEARGAAVEPVETEDGRITTVGQVVGAEPTEIRTTEPKPQTALEGVENAERLKGTKLRVTDNGIMSCNTFPELRVQVSAEGIVVEGLTDGTMAKPENMADAAAVVAQLSRIAKRNGLTVRFPTEEAAKVATAIANEVEQQGLAKTQAKLDTRAKLFGLLFKTTLGNGVTYDEASFKEALGKIENGRQFVDNHGNIYGFVDGEGKLHFNPTALNFNTPIHEYGHLALEAVKGINKALWKRGMELIRESDYYREIEEASKIEGHEYGYLKDKADAIADEALATMIGDRGERLVTERGLDGALKAWLKEVWKAFKGALGVADLTEEQIEKMTLGEFVDTINAELLRGSEFGVRRRPSGLTRREAAKARARREEGAHYQELAEREAAEAERTWQQSGMGIIDYVRSRAEEGDPEFDLDWEYMREIARDREAGRFSIGSTLRTAIESTAEYRDSHGNRRILQAVLGNDKFGRTKYAGKHCVDFGTATTGGFTLDEIERYETDILEHGVKRFDKKNGRRTIVWKSPEGVTFTVGTFVVGTGRNAKEIINTVHTDRTAKQTRLLKDEMTPPDGHIRSEDPTSQTVSAVPTVTTEALKSSRQSTGGIISNGGDGGNLATSRFSAGRDGAMAGAARDGKMAVAKLTKADYKKKRPQGTNELSLPRRKDPGLARGMDHGRAVGAVRLSLEAASILPNTSITVKRVYDNLVDIVRSIETGMPVMGMGKPVTERNFIKSLFNAGINTQTADKNIRNKFAGESSGYLSSDGRTVRVSTHPTEAECFLRNKTDNNISFVIRRPSVLKEMTPNDKANVLEIVFNRNSLRNNPEDMARIVHDIARFVATGEYNDTLGAAKYNYSGSKEFIADTMRSLIGDAEMREDAKTEKEIRKEAKRRGIKLNITEIGEPTLTASSTLANANLVPGVNATTGAPGSAYTGESAYPTRGIIPNGGDGGNLAKMAVGGRIAAESLGKTKEYDQAERMLKEKGANPLFVWKQTGFWKGADGKLRFEIPDGKLKPIEEIERKIEENRYAGVKLGDIIEAKELFDAYPYLNEVPVHFYGENKKKGGGVYSPSDDSITILRDGIYGKTYKDKIERYKKNIDKGRKRLSDPEEFKNYVRTMDMLRIEHGTTEEVREDLRRSISKLERDIEDIKNSYESTFRSTLMHEIQHAIQERELFARGTGLETARKLAEETLGEKSKTMSDYELYEAFAGEVEARNVQKRLGMTDAERGEKAPWETEDVRANDQIVRFSVKRPVERTKDLIAVHNVDLKGIRKVSDMGGFAMPSIAVTKDKIGHKEFGNCTVLFSPSSIDPKTNRQNALYSHDAWTPTFPAIYNKIDEKGIEKTNERILRTLPKELLDAIRNHGYQLDYVEGIHDAFDRANDAAEAYAGNILVKAAYLASKGEDVSPVLVRRNYFASKSGVIRLLTEKDIEEIDAKLGDELVAAVEGPGSKAQETYKRLLPELKKLLSTKNRVVKSRIEKEGEVGFGSFEVSEIADIISSIRTDKKSGAYDKMITDKWGTEDAIRKRVDEDDPEYRSWINSQYDNPILGKGVYNGKDRFTSSGNRRSWEALHDPATLENIVRSMKKTQIANGSGIIGRNPFGVAVRKFKSVKEMTENENILQPITREEEKAIKDTFSDRLSVLVIEYMQTKKHLDDNKFIEHDRALDMMFDAWESARGNMAELKKQLNGWGYSADETLAKKIMSVFDDMSVMTTNYFEAKPQRPVRFNEMKAWIVPDTITPEDSRILAGNGQRVFTYRAGDEADRLRVVNAAAEATNAKFSAGRGGAMAGAARDGEKYGYEALAAKPPMKVRQYGTVETKTKTVNGRKMIDTDNIIRQAVDSIRKNGTTQDGKPTVRMNDTGRDVIVDADSLRHARPLEIARFPDIYANYGDILANSIVVNEATSTDPKRSAGEKVALGMAINRAGRPVFVRSIIDSQNGADRISETETVYAVDARKGDSASRPTPAWFSPQADQSRAHANDGITPSTVWKGETEISIAQLLEMSKGVFGDVFSQDVNRALGLEREDTKLGNTLKFDVGAGGIDPSVFVFDPAAKIVAMGETEQNAGGLAAGIEKKEALRPWTKKMSPADLAKPIAFDAADMVMFWRAVSGSVRNPHVQKGERIAGRKDAIGLNVGGDRIEIVSKLFGVMDASDIERLRNDCKADGFFRNEDADWCAGRSKGAVASETERSKAELDRRTRELYRTRVATGEGGMHYATQVLGHEIGHTLAKLPSDAKLGPVGDAMKTLYDSLVRELRRKADPLRPKGDMTVNDEIKQLIAWWHGQEEMPKYYEKPEERFAELFGIFLTQPESVQSLAPKAYDTCVKLIAENERLTGAYRKIVGLKWSGGSNDAVMRRVSATWDREAQEQYRKLTELTRQSVSLKRDWFNYALNDRFGPMFGLSERSVKAEKARLDKAVKDGAMSEQEAADRLKALTDEIDALRTSLYNWQRQSGGATRLMIAGFDDVKRQAEKDGVNWDDVRNYAHYMRVVELGGRATAHGVDPARAAAILDEMSAKLGTEKWTQVEKTWKAYRAVYERFVLEDPNVREIFDEATNKMLWENKHYVTMKHRMGVEESAEWKAKIEAYRKENGNAWDPCIDIQQRMHKGIGNAAEGGQGFVLHHLVGSFEATEDPIAATMKRAIEIKEAAARNHLLKQTSETLRACGVKGVYDTAGGKGHAVDPGVYGKLTYMLDGVKHELIVPKVIERSYKADTTLSLGGFADAMRFIRNTMTLWNPAFINRAYLIDKSSLETNLKGLHKPLVDIVSEALCFRGVGVPLYMANNYLTRFTPIAKTWVGKILWNENTVNHYAYRAQKIARMIYEGKFGERLEEARQLRSAGETAQATEIEENVAVAREMLKRNVFQSQYEFNAEQRVGLNTDDILRTYGYRIEGGKVRKAGQRWNRFEEEQEACTKIIAYLYRMKQDAAEGKTSEADAAARARLVVEQGGTPNLAARGVMASYIENATGFFWNVRKEGALRSLRALKDHPTEWITKNLAQTATPAVLKALMLTGGLSLLVRKLFDDDEEKIAQSWWAPAVLEHAEFVREAMKCVPGYYQRNYNVIPLAKFGNEVVSMRVKYSPEEFALQNAIHNAFQRLGADPTDPSSDWSTLTEGMWNEFMPNIFGRNYALDAVGTLVGPLVGINPYDQYRQRNVYDKTTWEAKWNAPGNMLKEMGKNFWNYSPLGTFTTTFKNGQERKLEESDVPTWLDMVLQTPLVRMIPASMLAVTSSDSYTKALKEVDEGQKAYARIVARDILADCIGRGSLGGFAEGLKELKPELRTIAIRHVINGWREYHADPRAKVLKGARAIKDPMLKKKALDWIEKGMKYGD